MLCVKPNSSPNPWLSLHLKILLLFSIGYNQVPVGKRLIKSSSDIARKHVVFFLKL